jgi:DnaK suppressor protein
MTPGERDGLRALIEARIAEALALDETSRDARQIVELDQTSVGRLSRMDAMQQPAMADATAARRRAGVTRLRAALARIDTDDFGFCDECGDAIPLERLGIDPSLTRCAGCMRGG